MAGELGDGPADQLWVGARLAHGERLPAGIDVLASVELSGREIPPGRIGVEGPPPLGAGGDELGEGGDQVERRRLGHGDGLEDRAARHLDPHVGAGAAPVGVGRQLVPVRGPRGRAGGVGQDRRPRDRAAEGALEVVDPRVALARRDVHDPLADLGGDAHQRLHLGLLGHDRRHRPPAVADVEAGPVGGKSEGAAEDRLPNDAAHPVDLGIGGRPFVRLVAQDVDPYRRVPDVAAEVDGGPLPPDQVEVLRVGLEVPLDAGGERLEAHVLDLVEGAAQRVPGLRPGGGDAVAAVAGHNRGDAVPARRRQRRVPQDLGVVVGVDVDEPGDDEPSRRVDLAAAVDLGPDLDHPAVVDADVGPKCRRAGPVDHRPSPDGERRGHIRGEVNAAGPSPPAFGRGRSPTRSWSTPGDVPRRVSGRPRRPGRRPAEPAATGTVNGFRAG